MHLLYIVGWWQATMAVVKCGVSAVLAAYEPSYFLGACRPFSQNRNSNDSVLLLMDLQEFQHTDMYFAVPAAFYPGRLASPSRKLSHSFIPSFYHRRRSTLCCTFDSCVACYDIIIEYIWSKHNVWREISSELKMKFIHSCLKKQSVLRYVECKNRWN